VNQKIPRPVLISLPIVVLLVLIIIVAGSPFSSSPDEQTIVDPGGRRRAIQIDVLNGTTVPGLALQMTKHLRAAGFDVVEVGNTATQDLQHTIVIDRMGNREAALAVAQELGIGSTRILEKPDPTLYLDVSVHIGADYRDVKPFR